MSWFQRKNSRPAEQLRAPVIKFIGEQDGLPERDLKALFVELFREKPTVQGAYLARADYGDATGANVALCVKSSIGEDTALVSAVSAVFGEMFNTHEHLDILFIRDDQEQQLRAVCRPFYERSSSSVV